MLKTRVIPTLLASGRELVKGVGFQSWRRVGTVMQAARVHEMRGVDELVILDITATAKGQGPNLDLIRDLTDECFMPVTVGGGVRSVDDVCALLHAGADKVAINTAAFDNPDLIAEASRKVGAQAIVVSIDTDGAEVLTRNATHRTGLDPVDWVRRVTDLGAGEILLCRSDRDGTLDGYDLETIASVASAVSVPVIASGGCSGYADMVEAIRAGAHAVAAGALFTFTDATPKGAAEYLAREGIAARVAS